MSYLISYDLKTPGKDYKTLYEAIKSLGDCAHILDSVWITANSGPAGPIRDKLKAYIDRNDKLFVVELGRNWASYNLGKEKADQLQKIL